MSVITVYFMKLNLEKNNAYQLHARGTRVEILTEIFLR